MISSGLTSARIFLIIPDFRTERSCVKSYERLGELGISPKLITSAQDLIITEFLQGRTLQETDLQDATVRKALARL